LTLSRQIQADRVSGAPHSPHVPSLLEMKTLSSEGSDIGFGIASSVCPRIVSIAECWSTIFNPRLFRTPTWEANCPAIDVAKVDMVAAVAAAGGRVLQTISWKVPEQNSTVLSILRGFRAAGSQVRLPPCLYYRQPGRFQYLTQIKLLRLP
jgi:hypothetical protein